MFVILKPDYTIFFDAIYTVCEPQTFYIVNDEMHKIMDKFRKQTYDCLAEVCQTNHLIGFFDNGANMGIISLATSVIEMK